MMEEKFNIGIRVKALEAIEDNPTAVVASECF